VDSWYGHKAKGDENWKASDDRRQALTCALQLSGGDDEAAALLVKWAERMADVMVEKHWSKVHKLAFALLEFGKLSGDQVHNLLGRNGRNGSNGR
jgi:hypothetical protein